MYDQYYGLSGRPFQLTPDPEFYFESASHKKAMSYLGYGLNQGEGFIVITGEVGAGKSTLVAHLMERINPEELTVAQVVTTALDGEELIHVIAQAFGIHIEGKDKASALGAIERFLQDEAREGKRCLLVVDECQNLDLTALEEMRMLSNFQLGSHPLLQTLLLGQPEFRRTLAQHPDLDQLRQRIIASHHLEALDGEEVEDYIIHRLKHVGWDGRPSLRPGLLPALFEATDGIPRRVNQVMNRLLLLGAIEEQDAITTEMLEAVMEEMGSDAARGSSAQPSPLSIEPSMQAAEPATEQDIDSVPATEVAALLAQRDARTAELEAAISDLQAAGNAPVSEPARMFDEAEEAEVNEALDRIEQRLEEQEQSFRHVLTMLIEWLEDNKSREGGVTMNAANPAFQDTPVVNGLSVDVEDWFQVGAFENVIERSDWDGLKTRVENNVDRIIDLFAQADVKATFFTLGWIAERHPALIHRIADAGHEVASHGYDHARVFTFTRDEFAADIAKAQAILQDASGQAITGYRAPSFSIDNRNPWAFEVLAEQGYIYSSSVAPITHDHYGWREAPRFAFRPLSYSDMIEIPVTTAILGGKRVAAGGGGFFRVLPYAFSRWAIRQVNRREDRPAVFYFHPWEIDPDQPRVPDAPLRSKLRHYTGLDQMAGKLTDLAGEFAWGRMDDVAAREAKRAGQFFVDTPAKDIAA